MTNAAQMWHVWKAKQMETIEIDTLLKNIMKEMGYVNPTVNAYLYGGIDIRFALKNNSYSIILTNNNSVITFRDYDVPDANLYTEEGVETFKRNITLIPALQKLQNIQDSLKGMAAAITGQYY